MISNLAHTVKSRTWRENCVTGLLRWILCQRLVSQHFTTSHWLCLNVWNGGIYLPPSRFPLFPSQLQLPTWEQMKWGCTHSDGKWLHKLLRAPLQTQTLSGKIRLDPGKGFNGVNPCPHFLVANAISSTNP